MRSISGSANLKGSFIDRELLIIGNGPGLLRYKLEIQEYISQRMPIVLAINAKSELAAEFIDYYCISYNSKFLSENEIYKNLTKPIILPKHRFGEEQISNLFSKAELIDYGLNVAAGKFQSNATNCTIPFESTAAYAFAIALNTEAKQISLVGFDGYEKGDVRQNEMLEIISLLKSNSVGQKIVALTPTAYPLDKGSVYAPNI